MNLCACKDLSNIELLNVQTVTAVTVMINSAMRTSSLFDVRWPADHSIEASPIARRSLVSGSDVKRERSESRSDAEGALDSRTGDQILQKRGGRAPDSALIGVGDNRHIAVGASLFWLRAIMPVRRTLISCTPRTPHRVHQV
jgi:hypothetical protein